jgi:spore coat protein CotH
MKTIYCILLLTTFFSTSWGQGTNLFNDAVLHEIHFNNVDTNVIINSKNYQIVTMVVDGQTVDSIGFKKKGNISAFHPNNKFPFKIKTNKYVAGRKHDGIKEFTLHNNYEDPTYMRSKITYDLCGEMGLYALRTAYAKVYIDGNYWGLYTLLEGKDQLYKLKFDNTDGDAIESLDFGNMCYLGPNPSSYDYAQSNWPYYQLENGSATTAWPNFITMIDQANNTSDANYVSTVSQTLNLEHFFTYQAINVYLLNFDSYLAFKGNQIYYYDTTATKWQVIPWDFNASLGLWDTNNASPTTYSILPSAITTGCIASKLQTVPALKNYYMDAMCLMQQYLLDTTVMNNKIDQLKAQIQAAVYSDWRKMYSNTDFDNALEYGYYSNILAGENIPALKTFFTDRATVISQGIVTEGYSCPVLSTNSINNKSQQEITIFPNPSYTGQFTIESDITSDYNLEVFNSIGQKVYQKLVQNTSITNLYNLNKGVYFLSIHSEYGQQTKTIVVQ